MERNKRSKSNITENSELVKQVMKVPEERYEKKGSAREMTLDGIMQGSVTKQVEEHDGDPGVVRQWGGATRISQDPNFNSKMAFRKKKDTQTRW